MKPYKQEELEKRGFFDTLLSGKPEENAWKEIGNLLAGAEKVTDLKEEQLKKAAAKWGVSFNERNTAKRSAIYRQLAEAVYRNIAKKDDPWLHECEALAKMLGLSPQLAQLANRGAKNVAYGDRCRGILDGTEPMDIHQLNSFFDYDYDDGLTARKDVFEEYFYKVFEKFEKTCCYSLEDEADLVRVTEKLDVPFELKENLTSALARFRNLWNAETQELRPIEVEFPLQQGEECYAGTNSGRCLMKKIEVEDDFFDRNRKFNIDDTLAFKGNALDTNKQLKEELMLEEIGLFYMTNKRLLFFGKQAMVQHRMQDVAGADYHDNSIFFHMKDDKDVVYKFSDEASECMFMIFNRLFKGELSGKN